MTFAKRTYRKRADGRLELDYDPAIAQPQTPGAAPPDMRPVFKALEDIPTLVLRGALVLTGDGGRLRAHALRHLSLSQARILPSLQQGIQQGAFFPFDTLDLGLDAGATHQLFDEMLMRVHL